MNSMAIRKRGHVQGGDDLQRDEERATPHNRSKRGAGRSASLSVGSLCLIGLLLSLAGAIFLRVGGGRGHLSAEPANADASSSQVSDDAPPPKDWSHCDATPRQGNAAQVEKKLEPLWLPTYPTSLPASYETLLKDLTGIPSAYRNYYRQSKALKRCHQKNAQGNIDGVTCEIVHPIVPCQKPHPSAQKDNFGSAILVAIRNPISAFPAFHQEKAVRYHGVEGQVPREDWAKFRDEYLNKTLFVEWKGFINEWRTMEPYHVAAYLPYEHWGDEERGPQLARTLSSVLQGEGFPVLYNDGTDLECLWHTRVHEAVAAEERKLREEGWYLPEYTKEQLGYLSDEMQKFINEVKGSGDGTRRPRDEELLDILAGYRAAMLDLV